jgi:hypothetical protein
MGTPQNQRWQAFPRILGTGLSSFYRTTLFHTEAPVRIADVTGEGVAVHPGITVTNKIAPD